VFVSFETFDQQFIFLVRIITGYQPFGSLDGGEVTRSYFYSSTSALPLQGVFGSPLALILFVVARFACALLIAIEF